jgi:predicted CXXCH cytochrome family protein
MKKLIAAVAVVALSASVASALTIKGSKHDLSSAGTASVKSGAGQNQLCVYCHTPHNPEKAVPLWNRLDGAAMTGYYNSASLESTAAGANVIPATSVSAFCMSCHDGATQMGNIKNGNVGAGSVSDPNRRWAGVNNTATLTGSYAELGTDLTASHPVAFDYQVAQANDSGRLVAAPNALIKFYGAAGTVAGNYIQCSSCHAVHDNAIAPFLRMSMDSSALCLACHNK